MQKISKRTMIEKEINMSGIKEAREAAGLTRQEMAELFEIPYKTVQNWENGIRKPQHYVEKLIIEKLNSMKQK